MNSDSNKTKRHLAILGSTGSIGTQALDVIASHQELFEVSVLTANNQAELLAQQARQFLPDAVVIANQSKYAQLKESLSDLPIKVYCGEDAIAQVVESAEIDMVLTAMVGYAGLKPTIHALKARKAIALANKETLVVAGELITQLAMQHHAPIIPVDSEHSAIFQCLAGEHNSPIDKIILTASGGPFRGWNKEQVEKVTPQEALAHPNWNMGAKVTIDSASLMNKGLESIEAKWLFNVAMSQIEIAIHPQSIIHSMVQYEDGCVKAQLGTPDMRMPIQYAFSYPHRIKSDFKRLKFDNKLSLTFEEPDKKTFRNLDLAFEASRIGGNMPCIMNAANEIAVDAFLKGKIGFLQMSDLIEAAMQKVSYIEKACYEEYVSTDRETRNIATELLQKYN